MFDVASAGLAAQAGTLEDWVHTYLLTGDWANEGLAYGLKRQPRWWRGPLELPLAALSRCCGPEPEMEYVMDAAIWAQRVEAMATTLADPLALPPLIVEYRQGELSVRDGNKRHAAMASKGWQTCWVLIWYNSPDDHSRIILDRGPQPNETANRDRPGQYARSLGDGA